MTAHPSPDAIRAKLYREQRKAAPVPPDVQALLERGRRERDDLHRQAKAVRALGQIEATVASQLAQIQRAKHPSVRARRLGELADWIIGRRETLIEAAGVKMLPVRRSVTTRRLPHWVPADLADVYLDPTISEFEAAALVRQMKREAGGGE
jgi:hypothetical protein